MPFMKLLKSRSKLEPFWTPTNTLPYFKDLLIHRLFLLLTCNRSNLDLFEARIFPDILPDVNPRKTQGYWVFSLRHQIQDYKYFLASLWLKMFNQPTRACWDFYQDGMWLNTITPLATKDLLEDPTKMLVWFMGVSLCVTPCCCSLLRKPIYTIKATL